VHLKENGDIERNVQTILRHSGMKYGLSERAAQSAEVKEANFGSFRGYSIAVKASAEGNRDIQLYLVEGEMPESTLWHPNAPGYGLVFIAVLTQPGRRIALTD